MDPEDCSVMVVCPREEASMADSWVANLVVRLEEAFLEVKLPMVAYPGVVLLEEVQVLQSFEDFVVEVLIKTIEAYFKAFKIIVICSG